MIQSRDDLLSRIHARVQAGPRVPANCRREAVERRTSVYGGWYAYRPLPDELSAAEFPLVLVPPEPEYRDGFLKSAATPPHSGKLPALRRLANYKDAAVIAALQRLLDDRLVCEQGFELPDRNMIHQVHYEWGTEEPRLRATPAIEVRRTFVLRQAAYESLQEMGVAVERPELSPEQVRSAAVQQLPHLRRQSDARERLVQHVAGRSCVIGRLVFR